MARIVVVLLHLPTLVVLWDAFRFPGGVWRAAGVPRPAWVVIQVVLGAFGAVLYVARIRPKLAAVVARPAADSA